MTKLRSIALGDSFTQTIKGATKHREQFSVAKTIDNLPVLNKESQLQARVKTNFKAIKIPMVSSKINMLMRR